MTRLWRALALSIGLALLAPVAALAHAELLGASPADGAELTTPPTEVVMTFGGELQAGGSGFVVTGPDGGEAGTGELDLEVAARDRLRGEVDASEPGEYTVAWTAVALDGHEEHGTLAFTVLGDDGSDDATPPDTALSATESPPLAAIGAALLVAAAAWPMYRRAGRRWHRR